jgi:hypothetical protein
MKHRLLPPCLWLLLCLGGAAIAETSSTPATRSILSCAPGPWGRVSYYHFYLEAPDYVVAQFPLPSSITKWVFNVEELDLIGRGWSRQAWHLPSWQPCWNPDAW